MSQTFNTEYFNYRMAVLTFQAVNTFSVRRPACTQVV